MAPKANRHVGSFSWLGNGFPAPLPGIYQLEAELECRIWALKQKMVTFWSKGAVYVAELAGY